MSDDRCTGPRPEGSINNILNTEGRHNHCECYYEPCSYCCYCGKKPECSFSMQNGQMKCDECTRLYTDYLKCKEERPANA